MNQVGSDVIRSSEGSVAVLCMARGSENVLVPSLRAQLVFELERAIADDAIKSIVLAGLGRGFSSGIDLEEYNRDLSDPWVSDLCQTVENAPKPVVASLHGATLGAGFELALAAHARVAEGAAKVALPEIRLGMIPSGGGTQRLPRLAGAKTALKMLLTGQVFSVNDPMLAPVFARIVSGEPLSAATHLAFQLAEADVWGTSSQSTHGFSDPMEYQEVVASVRRKLTASNAAEADILKCIEAAQLLPFDQGAEIERTLFEARRVSSAARGSRHAFAAERRARAMPDLVGVIPKDIKSVVIAGASTHLAELAVACLNRRSEVTLLSDQAQDAERIDAQVRAIYQDALQHGHIDILERDACLRNLSFGTNRGTIKNADLILDDGTMPIAHTQPQDDVAWCVLDEAVPIMRRADDVGHPVLGLRVYRPAHFPRLVELASQDSVSPKALATVISFFSGLGASVLRVKDQPGLLGHRLLTAVDRAALFLVRAGADLFAVDAAAEAIGLLRGPFRAMGEAGSTQTIERIRRVMGPQSPLPEVQLLENRAAHASDGKSADFSFYVSHDKQISPDPKVRDWLATWRSEDDGATDHLSGVEQGALQLALHAALVNEAARMIDEQVVLRASDIDLCMLKGYGFDRAQGGPLLKADIQGLLPVLRTMKALSPLSEIWAPHPLIEDMVKNGKRFFS